jgi:hypothetical protein
MNERIKELADQVGLDTQHNVIVLTKNVDAAEAFEQFALLIVRECIGCINETDKHYIFTAQDAGVIGAAHNRSIKTIKEHFGVEE